MCSLPSDDRNWAGRLRFTDTFVTDSASDRSSVNVRSDASGKWSASVVKIKGVPLHVSFVYENAGFVAFCPFAARFPFEITIMPRRQTAYYSDILPEELLLLADALKMSLQKLSKALNQPQYNIIIHTAPARYAHHGYWTTIDQDFRWHIEILPRLTLIAGFEVGTGFYINPTPPEESAKYLREISV